MFDKVLNTFLEGNLTFSCVMPQNGETHFKNIAANSCKIFKVCLIILGHYATKD